jgi:hypothetical protein
MFKDHVWGIEDHAALPQPDRDIRLTGQAQRSDAQAEVTGHVAAVEMRQAQEHEGVPSGKVERRSHCLKEG